MVSYYGIFPGDVVESSGRLRYRPSTYSTPIGTVASDGLFVKGVFYPVLDPIEFRNSPDLSDRVITLESYKTALQTELACINERLENLSKSSVQYVHLKESNSVIDNKKISYSLGLDS